MINSYHGIQNYLVESVVIYCEQIQTGAKLVSEIGCHKRFLTAIKKTVKQENCKVIFDYNRPYDRITAYIYKYNFVKILIKELLLKNNIYKPTLSEIWSTGKLFGYSDYEIALYLQEHGYIKNALM